MIPQVADSENHGLGEADPGPTPCSLFLRSSHEGEAPQESQEVATASLSIKYRLAKGRPCTGLNFRMNGAAWADGSF